MDDTGPAEAVAKLLSPMPRSTLYDTTESALAIPGREEVHLPEEDTVLDDVYLGCQAPHRCMGLVKAQVHRWHLHRLPVHRMP